MKYQTYPAYKDSGVEWFGKVPEHWYPLRFKYVISEKKKTSNANLDAGSISFGKVIYKNNENLSTETKDSYQEVLAGEFLINPLNLNYDLLSLRTALSTINVVVSTGYIVLLCEQRLVKNYVRWLLYQFDVAHMKTLGAGVRQTINFSDIGNSFFLEPSPEEQQKIAQFLDHETAKIDTLIEKQQRLIELLKEKRQAVISHAVTKGLNPNAPMKPSGVEWLGDVPVGWDILKGGLIGRLFGSESVSDENVKSEGDIPFIKVSTLSLDGVTLGEIDFFVDSSLSKQIKTNINYLVFPKRGAAIFTNKVNIVSVDSVIDPNLMGWEIGHKAKTEFIAHLLKLRGLADIADVSTVPQINNKHISPLKFPIPPIDEQDSIIDFLKLQTKRIDSLIEKSNSAIELMQERRTALISAAVTGKIDVREWRD